MAINYAFQPEKDVLFVKAYGQDDSVEDLKKYGMAVLEEAVSIGVSKVICDETSLIYTVGVFDIYESAKFISAHAPLLARVAIVCSPAQFRDAFFYETVSANRGLQMKAFTSEHEARQWIGK